MKFHKYSGSGNDFIFIDNMSENFVLKEESIINWCKRREGIGADGVVLISPSNDQDFQLRIFNADGSEAEMCGNASRCSIHFAKNYLSLKKSAYSFETMNGVYSGELVSENEVRIKMTELYDMGSIDISDLGGKNTLYLNTGVPHSVIQVSSVDDVKVNSMGSVIRYDKRFQNGSNVDFFEVIDSEKQKVKLRVYERGVEDETLCCGTGIMATAVGCSKFFGWSGEISVVAQGGELKAIVSDNLEELYFQGRVHHVYEGELSQ